MIYTIDDAMDAIQGELSRHGDGDVELDVWENKSEGLWYAALRQRNADGTTTTIQRRGPDDPYVWYGVTLRAAIRALAIALPTR